MALYDNKFWLLSHIRNSFISTDDTGMCELVMVGEGKDIKTHLSSIDLYPDPQHSDDDEDDFEFSYNSQQDLDFRIRERSNTAIQLERLEQARKKAAKIRHIKWESNSGDTESLDDMFVKKHTKKLKKHTSLLSTLMKNSGEIPKNPYIEYAKYDGSGQVNIPVKKYKIYLTMLPPEQRNYHMIVCCIANAKVQDLIGLILLKCSYSQEMTNLKCVGQYGLYITEEDGEVDRDFPCLDANEPISKFGFTCLGLVEHNDNFKSVSFTDDSQLLFSTENQRARTLSDKAKADETRQIESDMQVIEEHNKLMEAPLYKSFQAFIISKVKPRLEVNIGVSGERIEIDPVPQKTNKLMPFKQKAVSHPIDSIAWCEMTDIKSNRSSFRIIYSICFNDSSYGKGESSKNAAYSYPPSMQNSTSYKHYDFESDSKVAQDIVQKIKLILESRASSTWSQYIASKGKRLHKQKLLD